MGPCRRPAPRTWMNSKPAFSEAVKKAEGKAAVKWLAKIEALGHVEAFFWGIFQVWNFPQN